jgi:hypothetical protein
MISPSSAVLKKFAETLIMDTRVVDEARVSAVVNRLHMAILKRRLRPKNAARIRYSTILLSGERDRTSAIVCDHDVVRAVVVLPRADCESTLSPANYTV